jgi:DNA-binding MarR family transcriptional regulator
MSDNNEITKFISYTPNQEEEKKKITKNELKLAQKQAIFDFIAKKTITFPSEIRRSLGLSKDRCYDLLWELTQEGLIKRHFVPDEPCACFQARMQEFWSYGIESKALFKKITWFVLATNNCGGGSSNGNE